MAAPVKQRPGRYLGFVALVLVALYLGVFLGPASTPKLGLDLRGGTQVTLTAQPIAGGKVTKSALNQAVAIIRKRANGLGVGGADVSTQGNDNIVVAVPGGTHDQVVKTIGQTALLRFRQVMALEAGVPAPAASTSASPSATPSSKASGKAKSGGKKSGGKKSKSPKNSSSKAKSSSGDALASVLEKPAATGSATPTPTVTPAPATSSAPAAASSATPAASPNPTSSSAATNATTDTPLPGSQSATLTSAFGKSFANWNCLTQNNPTRGADNPADYIIACDSTGTKYLLGPAVIEGTDVKSASSGLDPTSGTQWVVNLTFNGKGSSAWYAITKKTYEVNNGQPSQEGSCQPPKGCDAVGIVLDGVVQSAPYSETDGIPGGSAEISGSFTESDANTLADTLKYGALPLKFSDSDVQTVSATLGAAQLRGGLIAGIIGLGLVVIFSLLYYRALGLVTVGSLAVSGLILYAATVLLGHSSVGYTLSLPGIAGFIVAVGITADSFVVFFERLRDEIRDGRRLRSGVDRAWPRARRTILSADTVSLLAAVILYAVSIGDVRGFAFTLGLSTISDLFIVFFFTKPLLMVLAKVPAFDSGKTWTGVGKARAGVARDAEPDRPARPGRRPRTREA
ncbi:MAG TPA: protein translocase subunit SecD [Mycobacteriales bacterium]|nr:protein translocase subunit SecD [Mycobacteriales bacterium]